jgi:hypothetical protein
LRARREGATARFELGPGIQPEVDIKLSWPRRERPIRVLVDGRETTAYDARGIELAQPFRTLVAEW